MLLVLSSTVRIQFTAGALLLFAGLLVYFRFWVVVLCSRLLADEWQQPQVTASRPALVRDAGTHGRTPASAGRNGMVALDIVGAKRHSNVPPIIKLATNSGSNSTSRDARLSVVSGDGNCPIHTCLTGLAWPGLTLVISGRLLRRTFRPSLPMLTLVPPFIRRTVNRQTDR